MVRIDAPFPRDMPKLEKKAAPPLLSLTPVNLRLDGHGLFLPDAATCTAKTGWFEARRNRSLITGDRAVSSRAISSRAVPSRTLSSEDIIVLGSLAGIFCWTYIILPVLYHDGLVR
jgi:hypothetical protein